MLTQACLSEKKKVVPVLPVNHTATADELLEHVAARASSRSLKSTVLLELRVLNDERTERETFREVKGAVVGRRPDGIRVQAQVPVTGQRAFDMTSDGESFRVYLAWERKVYEGETALDARSEKRVENIRPGHVLEPLLIEPPRDDEIAVLVNRREGRTPYQILQLLRRKPSGDGYWLAREFYFNRTDLAMSRLEIFTPEGDLATVARYGEWVESEVGPRPTTVAVSRPLDGYDLNVRLVTPKWDAPVEDDAFILDAPENVEIVPVGEAEALAAGGKR